MFSLNNIVCQLWDKKVYDCYPYGSCFYSSFVFLLNVALALYYGYYLYATLFFALMINSLLQHSHYNLLTTIIDKIVIYCIVFYGGYIYYNKIHEYINNDTQMNSKEYILSFLIASTFLSNILLYYYGYFYNCLCFCDDNAQANLFNSFMHFLGSFGHCCIILF